MSKRQHSKRFRDDYDHDYYDEDDDYSERSNNKHKKMLLRQERQRKQKRNFCYGDEEERFEDD